MRITEVAWWCVKYDLTRADAGLLYDTLHNTASARVVFSDKTTLITNRRTAIAPVRASVSENERVYAISKDSLNLVQSDCLKAVIRIILTFNTDHGGHHVSSNAETWRKDYDKQRRD